LRSFSDSSIQCLCKLCDKQFIMFVITSSQVFLGMKFSNAVKQKTCLSRRDSVLLNRLRIGYTHLTHSFLLSGDDLPVVVFRFRSHYATDRLKSQIEIVDQRLCKRRHYSAQKVHASLCRIKSSSQSFVFSVKRSSYFSL